MYEKKRIFKFNYFFLIKILLILIKAFNGKRKSYVIIESPQRHIQISKTTDKEVISVRELTSDDKMKLVIEIEFDLQ